MSLKLSTGLRNKMLGLQATVSFCLKGATLVLTASDTITHSDSGFITGGLAPNDILYLTGATTGANDTAVTGVAPSAVAAGVITLPDSTVANAETFAAATVLAAARGGSVKDIFMDGVLYIYSGSQPANADAAASGTQLVKITVSAGAFSAGAFTNGLEFGDSTSGYIEKSASETWQGTGLASGTAGWFRLCGNPTDALAASALLPRIDGSIGTSGADLNMGSTTVTASATYTIDTFKLTLPSYYGA